MIEETTPQSLDEWAETATDRDIQLHMLRVAIQTREKVETIRSIISFLFVLWLIGMLVAVVATAASS